MFYAFLMNEMLNDVFTGRKKDSYAYHMNDI